MKKLLALILAIVMVAGMSVTALADESAPAFKVSTAEAEAGEQVVLTVSTVNNPGIASFTLTFNFDASVLTLVDIVEEGFCEKGFFDMNVNTKSATWITNKDQSADEVILSLKFSVNSAAPSGFTAVSASYSEGGVVNVAEDKLKFDTISGGVTVKGTQPPVHIHEWVPGTITKQPTCTEEGEQIYTCTGCNETKTEKIPAKGHTPVESKENEKAATCEEAGSYDKVTKCSVCGKELSRETVTIPATGHKPVESKENEKAATCEEAGSYDKVTKCSVCGKELSRETVTIPATGHKPGDPVKENEVPATATQDGSYDSVIYCTVCGKEISRDHIVVPINHTAGDPVKENEKPATCEEAGSYDVVVYCKDCGEEISRETKVIPATGHDWGEWEIVEEATEEKEGKKVRVCKNDPEHIQEEVIPKVTPEVPPTGDTSNMGIWAVLMLAAAAALAFLGFKRRRV